jgi:hypothetical protein
VLSQLKKYVKRFNDFLINFFRRRANVPLIVTIRRIRTSQNARRMLRRRIRTAPLQIKNTRTSAYRLHVQNQKKTRIPNALLIVETRRIKTNQNARRIRIALQQIRSTIQNACRKPGKFILISSSKNKVNSFNYIPERIDFIIQLF